MAEGRLTVDELDQRVGRLYASRTRAQAAALIADLPPLAAPEADHHFHIGHERDDVIPALPGWLSDGGPWDFRSQTPAPAPGGAAAPQSHAQERAAARKRTKHHQDEDAIGHAFQITRRAITTALEAARSAGDQGEADRLGAKLQEAKETAAVARRALAAGDRAELQRQLQRLRSLG